MMEIRTRMCVTLDGYVTTPDGWPVQLADPGFSAESYGFTEFQQGCGAVLMGRTTFEPALEAERWPWPGLDVFVLASERPARTPEHVITDSDPARLLGRLRESGRDGYVHLVGGPRTVETFRALGALDKLGLLVVPLLVGDGMRLTPALSTDTTLTLESERAVRGRVVEITYAVSSDARDNAR
jgi:dihydrofolate reductase